MKIKNVLYDFCSLLLIKFIRNQSFIRFSLIIDIDSSIPCSVKLNSKPFEDSDSFIFSYHLIDSLPAVLHVNWKLIFPVLVRENFFLVKCWKNLLKNLHQNFISWPLVTSIFQLKFSLFQTFCHQFCQFISKCQILLAFKLYLKFGDFFTVIDIKMSKTVMDEMKLLRF